ncbi:MAG TPA: cytochrome c oxidase subunit II [Ilumatobacteraceae bacterium]|jgi:cytochrome c oxidase subunit 2
MSRWFWRAVHVGGSSIVVLSLAACSGPHSMLSPHSPEGRSIAATWWLMFAMAVVVYIVVTALVVIAISRRPANVPDERRHRFENRFIVVGGLALPVMILAITAIATVQVANELSPASASAEAPVQITVEGELWWWRIEYPNEHVVTANEIHVPIGQKVDIKLVSDNVIHSLWIPELNGKQDLVPGQVNHLRFTADKVGRFDGRCAEFCGIQHARMEFIVFVDSADDYRSWIADNQASAAQPTDGSGQTGQQLFETSSCAGCHTIVGTSAQGSAGPDLTHVASRKTLAAGTIDNTPERMAAWLDHTQSLKHGALMPEVDLTKQQIDALVAYLERLK